MKSFSARISVLLVSSIVFGAFFILAAYQITVKKYEAVSFPENITLENFRDYAYAKSAENAYETLKKRYSSNPIEAHNLTHIIGEVIYFNKDPRGIAFCDPFSNYGCFHGYIAAFIDNQGERAIVAAETECKKLSPTNISSCIHGIGHGILGWTGYDLTSSLAYCDTLVQESRIYCYDGVFMENLTGSMRTSDDQAQNMPDSSRPWYPCTALNEKYKNACYRQHVFGLYGLYYGDFRKIASLCEDLNREYRLICAESYGLRAAMSAAGNADRAKKYCSHFTNRESQDTCFIAIMSEFLFEGMPLETVDHICEWVSRETREECKGKYLILREEYRVRHGK